MASFVDRALVQLGAPDAVADLLTAGAPGPYPRLERLVAAVFAPEGGRVDHVADVAVLDVAPQVRFAPMSAMSGTLTTTQPAYAASDLRGTWREGTDARWADLVASLSLHLVIEQDAGGIESAVTRSLTDIASLDDFRSRFRYLDLDAFLAEHRITTVEQLREAYEYVLTEVRLKPPPPFDPADDAHAHDVLVDVAVVLCEQVDVAAGLRAAADLRAAVDAGGAGRRDPVLGSPAHALAVAVVFPEDGLAGSGIDADALDTLFARAKVLPLFANPP